ncbi:uncharacterized protein LOC135635778 [Musa acuminata AAA Group]|uniref:uncharacterized protein LOC135635778 n=1 Tax=Musa acuminata AAA Group TaxID=214697 RepID=UPI0031DA6D5F
MGADQRSTTESAVPWWRNEEEEKVVEDEAGWKCWKHPLQPHYGVCPACLRDRLLRLCPDCASVRPCGCFPSPSSSASSSSPSSAELAGPGGVGRGTGVGAVGPMSRLIDSEPSFRRSQSVGFPLHRSTSVSAPPVDDVAAAPRSRGSGKGWAPFLLFSKAARKKDSAGSELYRSRSVAAGRAQAAGCGDEEEGKGKGGRRWYFPSPMKVLRHWKSATKVVQVRSPLWRG